MLPAVADDPFDIDVLRRVVEREMLFARHERFIDRGDERIAQLRRALLDPERDALERASGATAPEHNAGGDERRRRGERKNRDARGGCRVA